MTFQITIAGVCVRITSIYDEICHLCRDYLEDKGEPQIFVETHPSDLEEEARRGREPLPLTEERAAYLETLAVYRRIAEKLSERDILLMHGVLLNCSGSGILITAPSGVGKTTRANLWTSAIPHTHVVNGDKPLISLGDSIMAYGTPWNGKENMGRNECVPLRAICLLQRGTGSQIRRVEPKEVLSSMLRQVYLSTDPGMQIRALSLLNLLCKKVPVYLMECDKETGSTIAVYHALCSDGIINPDAS